MRITRIELPGASQHSSSAGAYDADFADDPDSRRFRGVEVALPWAPAVVLFGRNDAGKSNVLTQISEMFEEQETRSVPPGPGGGTVTIAFDDVLRDDSVDALVLAQLIQFEDARFYFYRYGLPRKGSEERVLLFPDGLGEVVRIALGTDVHELSVIRERIKGQLLTHAARSCGDWVAVVRHFEAVLDACLTFRTLVARIHPDEVPWFAVPFPSRDELAALLSEALRELSLRRDAWEGGQLPFIEPLLAEAMSDRLDRLFFEIGTIGDGEFGDGFLPYKVVRLGSGAIDTDLLGEKVTEEIREGFGFTIMEFAHEFPGLARNISPNDWWFHREEEFEQIADAWVRVSPVVIAICEEISRRANDLAPRFIRTDYRIHVVPLPPDQVDEETRVGVLLALGDADSFDISEVSSGIALWTAYSVLESIRSLAVELLDVIQEVKDTLEPLAELIPGLSFLAEERSERDKNAAPPLRNAKEEEEDKAILAKFAESLRRDLVFPQRTLYVIDEPERHLHPLAQADVAAWIAALAQEPGADALVASHAGPFLSLPSSLAEYVLITRDENRVSRATPITADVIGLLDEVAEDSGMSRADLMQLVRTFLIVEGANDKRIIEHFFGSELRRERVLVVPLHGSSKLRLLAEAEVIRQMGRLILVLLDNTADETTAESRHIRDLLDHWPTDGSTPPPIPIRLAAPDIIRVFDDDAMSAALQQRFSRKWQGWSAIDQEFGETPSRGWKHLLRRRLPNDASEDELVGALLAITATEPAPPALRRALDEAVALASEALGPHQAQATPRDL